MRVIAALSVMFMAAACSPYLYKGELEAFSASTRALSEAAAAQRDWETADRRVNIERRARALYRRAIAANAPLPRPNLSAACATLVSPPAPAPLSTDLADALDPGCHLVLLQARELSVQPSPSDPAVAFTQSLVRANEELEWRSAHGMIAPILGALLDYAAGLVALTDVSDAESLAMAQGELAGGLGGLAAAVGHGSEAQERAALGRALGDMAGFLWRARLDQRRLETLRASVNTADGLLETLGEPVSLYLSDVRRRQVQRELRDLLAEVQATNARLAEERPSETDYVALILHLDAKAAELAAHGKVDPARAFERLVEAHHALREAVNDRGRQFAASTTALAGFADSLAAFEAAIAAFGEEEAEGGDDTA